MARVMAGQAERVEQQRPQQATHRKRRRFVRLRYVLVVGVVVWAGHHYLYHQLPQLGQLQAQQTKLTQQLASLRQQHQTLQNQEQEFKNPAYIAKYAAEHYGVVLPNQIPFTLGH